MGTPNPVPSIWGNPIKMGPAAPAIAINVYGAVGENDQEENY